jgi:hypothetical protein
MRKIKKTKKLMIRKLKIKVIQRKPPKKLNLLIRFHQYMDFIF